MHPIVFQKIPSQEYGIPRFFFLTFCCKHCAELKLVLLLNCWEVWNRGYIFSQSVAGFFPPFRCRFVFRCFLRDKRGHIW